MAFLLPKPAKGTALLARKAQRAKLRTAEDKAKAEAKKRDGYRCRWPRCEYPRLRVEAAHLQAKGMGGDHGTRSHRRNLMACCYLHHQGSRSLHSGDLRVQFLTREGADGACRFMEKQAGRWVVVGEERA
jgi:hypothetical protein